MASISIDNEGASRGVVETSIPARMDRMPWSRWHWMIVFALGITWILDGLEVTLVGNAGPVLQQHSTLSFSSGQVGATASIYLIGEVIGALFFGYMTDRLGRKKLFMVTLRFRRALREALSREGSWSSGVAL